MHYRSDLHVLLLEGVFADRLTIIALKLTHLAKVCLVDVATDNEIKRARKVEQFS